MRKVLGYIIVGKWGVYGLGFSPEEKNVLWSNLCTVFSTRKQANRAIQATKKYEAAHNYNWHTDELHIRRVDQWL
jgi:hypothetical protein